MAGKAVDFINQKYKAGEKIDGYTAYALARAGEDLTAGKWTGDKTLRSEVENLADLLGDSNSLITYICSTQNGNGSFGPYANEYGTKAPLQALAAVKGDLTAGGDIYNRVQNSIAGAVNYFKAGYQSGGMTYIVDGFNFDYRCVEALAGSGEDLSVGGWVYQGRSLKDTVVSSANSTVDAITADPSVKGAVYLAKELTALYAVDPASVGAGVLAGAIIARQDTSVAGQVYFGSGIYDDVVVLTSLGRTGRVGAIDQEKALAYLNTFKHSHTNSWGSPAGAAWGGYYPEESDLTAQVLTALSYFTGAGNPGSDVYNAIQDGLDYLADIQDVDTAAVTARWDSTFATAETLIALKALGKTYSDYAGDGSGWVRRSRTKTVAQCLLALSQWGDASRRDRLAGLLTGRQNTAGPGRGSFENSVYSDMWAYVALGGAGKTGNLDTGSARAYILSKQSADGSWGESFGGAYYPDVLSTAQAIRALNYLPGAAADPQVQDAVARGLAYLKGLQQADGGVYSAWDDPAVDNSELIVTLRGLGKDPAGADWKNPGGLTPVDYLLNKTMNNDGSFGSSKNVFGAAEALTAFLAVNGQGGSAGGSQPPVEKDSYSVNIAVVGQNGELLYGPGSVTVSKTGKWGFTALGALYATGLTYTEAGGFVSSIAGQANSGMNGWMYKVNGSVPAAPAGDKIVSEGDQVIWWYSRDMNSPGPAWDSLVKPNALIQTEPVVPLSLQEQKKLLPVALQALDNALAALEKVDHLFGEGKTIDLGAPDEQAVAVVGNIQPLDLAAIAALKKELARNAVDLAKKVTAGTGATLADAGAEVALSIPARALNRDVEITVKKIFTGSNQADGTQPAQTPGFRQVSAVYEFGPDGTTFAEPATLILKVAVPPRVRPENLALARYDKPAGKWTVIPAVVDVERGLILARVRHFSHYALFAGEPLRPFADVTPDSFGWAKNPIELLAGAGIVAGVDGTRFEPDRAVTRAEFASLLVKALGLQAEAGAACQFKDIRAGEWYAGAVTAAYAAGLVQGCGDGAFRPDSAVTREEAAVMLARAMKLQSPEQKITFADADRIAAWARAGVAEAVARGLIKGFPDTTFRPDETAGRAQCAVMVYRMLAD